MAVMPGFNPTPDAIEIRRGPIGAHFRHHPHGGVVITMTPGGPGMGYRLRLKEEEVQLARRFFGAPAEPTPHTPTVGGAFWDEERQLARVTVDGKPFSNHGYPTAADCRQMAAVRHRSAAAFDAMAAVLEGREEAERRDQEEAARQEEAERRDQERQQIISEVMEEAGYLVASPEGYKTLQQTNPQAARVVSIAVEARTKLKTVQDALGKQAQA